MQPFTQLKSKFVSIPVNNIDTDQIIPARFLKITDKQGLGDNLFYDWRYQENGEPKKDFILNREVARDARILVAGDNFGCGSSREHAPWALTGYGFKAIVSTSFADIFRNNSLKNGLLPVIVDEDTLRKMLEMSPGRELEIDLDKQTLTLPDGSRYNFPIDGFNKSCLLQGIDTLGYLLRYKDRIDAYEAAHQARVNTIG